MRNRIKIKNNNLGSTGTATLLWTNPSPSAAFAAQTISLDLSIYKKILIVHTYRNENPLSKDTLEMYKGIPYIAFGVNGNRQYSSDNNGVIVNNADSASGQIMCIPLYIYGLK